MQCVLEDVFIEADQNQRGEQLRREWNQDRSDHLDFWDDQVGNGLCIIIIITVIAIDS